MEYLIISILSLAVALTASLVIVIKANILDILVGLSVFVAVYLVTAGVLCLLLLGDIAW